MVEKEKTFEDLNTFEWDKPKVCPNCNAELNMCTAGKDDVPKGLRPQPEDYSLCFECGCISQFDNNLTLAWPDPTVDIPEELDRIRNNLLLQLKKNKAI